jgi:hypothetical protein
VRDGRVDKIVGLMSRGKWNGAASHRDLAQQWRVSVHAVAEYAREASGIVRRVIQDDPESIRAEILAGIEHVRVVAMRLVKPMMVGYREYEDRPMPDVGAALRAYELRAKMLGLMVDEVHVTETPARAASPDEERAELARLKADIEERERELAGKGGGLQ